MATVLKVPTIFSAVDKFSSVLEGMGKSVKTFTGNSETEVARLQRSMRSISASTEKVAIATGVAGAAIIAPLTLAVKAAMDYETSIASLSAITGATGNDLTKFKSKVEEVADAQKMAYAETAKAFELAGSAIPELLKNADALGKVSSAAITLSKASGEDLESSIRSLTGVMNQFSLGATQADRTINVLAAGAKVGAASIAQTSEAMVNFGSVAAGANMSVEQAVGAVQVLSKYSLFGAEAGTKLRGSLLKLQQAGVGYASGQFEINDALLESKKRIDKLRTAKEKDAAILKLFGAENISTGKILLNNIDLFKEYTAGVTATSEATIQAQIKSETLAKRWQAMKNQAQNLAVKVGEVLLPVIERIATKMEPLVKGFVEWTKANPKLFKGIIKAAAALGVLLLVISAISTVIYVGSGLLASWGALSTAFVVTSGFITSSLIPAFQFLIAAAQVLTATLLANPIGLIVVAIAALVAVVYVIIKKWNDWGAALTVFLGPLGMVISFIQSLRRNWEMVKEAFKTEGILSGLKAVGKVIMDAMIMPIQQLLGLVAKLTGAQWATKAVSDLGALRNYIGVNTTTDESGRPLVNAKAAQQQGMINAVQTNNTNKNVTFDFKNMPKGVEVTGDGQKMPVPALGSTFGKW